MFVYEAGERGSATGNSPVAAVSFILVSAASEGDEAHVFCFSFSSGANSAGMYFSSCLYSCL